MFAGFLIMFISTLSKHLKLAVLEFFFNIILYATENILFQFSHLAEAMECYFWLELYKVSDHRVLAYRV